MPPPLVPPPLVPPPLVPPPLVPPPVPPVAAVPTAIDGLAVDDELVVFASIPASEAAAPVPSALAPVSSPLLFASASPSASESVAAVLAVVSTEPSETESVCEVAEAEPSPAEFADTFAVADDDAEAVPSLPVEAAVAAADADAVPLISPPPVVVTSMAASAVEAEAADVSSTAVSLAPSAEAVPWASPSSLEVPVRLTDSVEPSAVAEVALADPEAAAPVPAVARSTDALTAPSDVTPVEVSLLPLTSPDSPPVALALVVDEESEVLPAPSSLCAEALPPADAEAPAPLPVASECDDVVAPPPPAVEWLSELALALAANAAVAFSTPCKSGATGEADSMRARALVEATKLNFNRATVFMHFMGPSRVEETSCLNTSRCRTHRIRSASLREGATKAPQVWERGVIREAGLCNRCGTFWPRGAQLWRYQDRKRVDLMFVRERLVQTSGGVRQHFL